MNEEQQKIYDLWVSGQFQGTEDEFTLAFENAGKNVDSNNLFGNQDSLFLPTNTANTDIYSTPSELPTFVTNRPKTALEGISIATPPENNNAFVEGEDMGNPNNGGPNIKNGTLIVNDPNREKDEQSRYADLFGQVGTGVSMENALFNLGESIGYEGSNKAANSLKGVASAGKLITAGARNLTSGIANTKRNKYVEDYYNRRQREGLTSNYTFEDGGEKENIKKLSGNYIMDQGSGVDEIEDKEHVKFPTGEVIEAKGDTHEKGGIDIDLPEGAKVLSDNLKVGLNKAKELSKRFGIKVKANDTYAKVVATHDKKLGLDKLNKEQEGLVAEIVKQDKAKDSATKKTNVDFLTRKIKEVESKKESLKTTKEEVFDTVYTAQEEGKQDNKTGNKFRDGGMKQSQVKELADKYGLTIEEANELLGLNNTFKDGGEKEAKAGLDILSDYLSNWEDSPDYKYKDITKTANRFKPFFDKYKIPYKEDDLKTIEGLDKLAGLMQSKLATEYPELTTDYGINIQPTRQGLQYLVDNKLIDPKESGVEIVNGKVKIGSYNILTSEQQKKLSTKIKSLDEKTKTEYGKKNFVDNKAYFRTLDAQEIPFADEESYNKYLEENKDNMIGEYVKTDKLGAYVKPVFNKPGETETETETDESGKIETSVRERIGNSRRTGRYFNPSQELLPPDAMEPHLKIQNRRQRIDPVKLGIEDNLTELYKQEDFITDQLDRVPDSQRAAALSNLLASTQEQANKAIVGTNRINAQNEQSAELFNIGQADIEDNLRGVNAQNFERLQLTAKAKTNKDLRDYMAFNRKVALNNYSTNQQINLLENLTPNYKINQDGSVVFIEDDWEVPSRQK